MNNNQHTIDCPHCNEAIIVTEVLAKQTEQRLQKEYASKLAKEKLALETTFREEEKRKLQAAFESELKQLRQENAEKLQENQELKQKEIKLLRQERKIKEAQQDLELEVERRISKQTSLLEESISKREQERMAMKEQEYQKQLADQKKLIDEMRRKAEQGSMQLQGEVQELALEAWLNQAFPFDQIEEIAKGTRGADARQVVRNSQGQACGAILYESKRAKAFSDNWLIKLKEDRRHHAADLAVLVTEVLPRDMAHYGIRDGVWICTFQEFKALVPVLREMLLKVAQVQGTQINKGEKMEMLYDYLTGSEFYQQVEAIVEGFSSMKENLDKERRTMLRHWKTQEKQIEKVITHTVEMYGAVQGIGGQAIKAIPALELAEEEES
jgi:hypothetical protein